MTKGETIAYAIQKQCSSYDLSDFCEEWDFSVDEFYEFLEAGIKALDKIKNNN